MHSQAKSILAGLVCLVIPAACATQPGNTAAVAGGAPGVVQMDPEKMIENAHALIEEQKYGQAQDSFENILSILPENEAAQAGLATAARLAGKSLEALEHYRQLEKYPARRAEALEGQGLALVQRRQWTQAEAFLLSALETDPARWRSWNALGQLRDHQKKWDEAEVAYLNAIALDPVRALIYNNLGVSYLCQSRYDDAIEQFDMSLELKSNVETVQGNRLVALAMKGDYEAAMNSIPPSNRQFALNNIGYVAALRGDEADADRFLTLAAEESPRFYVKADENLKTLK